MLSKLWKNALLLALFNGMMIVAFSVHAAAQTPNPIGPITTIYDLIEKLLNYVVLIAIPLAGLSVIVAGLWYVGAAAIGRENEIGKAKKMLVATLIGLACTIGAWSIAYAIQNFLKALGT